MDLASRGVATSPKTTVAYLRAPDLKCVHYTPIHFPRRVCHWGLSFVLRCATPVRVPFDCEVNRQHHQTWWTIHPGKGTFLKKVSFLGWHSEGNKRKLTMLPDRNFETRPNDAQRPSNGNFSCSDHYGLLLAEQALSGDDRQGLGLRSKMIKPQAVRNAFGQFGAMARRASSSWSLWRVAFEREGPRNLHYYDLFIFLKNESQQRYMTVLPGAERLLSVDCGGRVLPRPLPQR